MPLLLPVFGPVLTDRGGWGDGGRSGAGGGSRGGRDVGVGVRGVRSGETRHDARYASRVSGGVARHGVPNLRLILTVGCGRCFFFSRLRWSDHSLGWGPGLARCFVAGRGGRRAVHPVQRVVLRTGPAGEAAVAAVRSMSG